MYKAIVLINRLNLFWGIGWEALPHHVTCGRGLPDSDFLISCVDTRAARADIARIVRLKSRCFSYWLDWGNLANRGQLVLGQPLRRTERTGQGVCPVCMSCSRRSYTGGPDKQDRLPARSAAEALKCHRPT